MAPLNGMMSLWSSGEPFCRPAVLAFDKCYDLTENFGHPGKLFARL